MSSPAPGEAQRPAPGEAQRPAPGEAALCEPILRDLKAWFGLESAVQEYLKNIPLLDTFMVYREGAPAGFLTLKQLFPESAEIYVMGVTVRGRGLGRQLINQAVQYLKNKGVSLLQVKTLAPTVDYPPYEETRAFYRACGFLPLEIHPTLWDEQNPCLVMVKPLV